MTLHKIRHDKDYADDSSGVDACPHDEIKRLKEQLDKAVARHGIRHAEIDRIMSELDPLIAQVMEKQVQYRQ